MGDTDRSGRTNALQTFRAATTGEEETKEEPVEEEKRHGWKPRQPKGERSNLMASMQGAILLQAMFQMDVPAIETVINRSVPPFLFT
jgi:hypothetical protein